MPRKSLDPTADRTPSHAPAKQPASPPSRRSAWMKDFWADPETRSRMLARMKESNQRPEVRARRSAAAKSRWADAETRARMIAARTTPEFVARMAEIRKELLGDPDKRDRMLSGFVAAREQPATRAKRAEALARAHQGEEFRARCSAASRAKWADPEMRNRMIEGIKASWAARRLGSPRAMAPRRKKTAGRGMCAGCASGDCNICDGGDCRCLCSDLDRIRKPSGGREHNASR